jgi:signal-transduction protein with cAMP-binding, CBS, and nucleotidyltransferase domain
LSDDGEQELKKLKVRDVMAREPIAVDCERSIKETAIAMDRSGRGCVLITSKGRVIGIVTERDLVRRALTKGVGIARTKVKTLMSSPLIVVDPEARVEDAAKVMAQNRVRRLPVVDERGLVGLITVTDIARSLAEQLEYSNNLFNAMARVRTAPKLLYV